MVEKSIACDNNISGCDFDETDPSKFILKLFNSNERTLELRFIKIDNNDCTCKLSVVHLQDIKLHSNMTSLITSLNNYLVLIDKEKIMFINEDKVLIQTEMEERIFGFNSMSVSGTNDIIMQLNEKVQLLHFNVTNNELKVKTILECENISDVRTQNDYVIIKHWDGVYIYKLDDIKINNTSNPIVINKRLKEYCISSDKKYFIFTTKNKFNEFELFVYKLDNKIKQIACLFLNEENIKFLVSNEKYISMVDYSDKNILTFEINDETITILNKSHI